MTRRNRKRANKGEIELRQMFNGRRDGKRKELEMSVWLSCPETDLKACTINISRTGALFHLTDERFQGDGEHTFLYFSRVVQDYLEQGSTVDLGEGVQRAIEIVRVTFGGLGGAFAPFLACRFKQPLDKDECLRLGVSRCGERLTA